MDLLSLPKIAAAEDIKTFTQTLKRLEKAKMLYPDLPIKDAKALFADSETIVRKSFNKIARYNALRLAKYAVTTSIFVRRHAEEIWSLYRGTILDADGNVRNAGVSLLGRYYFGMSMATDGYGKRYRLREEEKNHLERLFAEQFFDLLQLEAQYLHDNLDVYDEESHCPFVPFASETRDPFLKNIRRGIEEFRSEEHMVKLGEKHGIPIPWRWESPEIVEQRYNHLDRALKEIYRPR